MSETLRILAMRLARRPWAAGIVRHGLSWLSIVRPSRFVRSTHGTITFVHPRPIAETHHVVVSRRRLDGLHMLSSEIARNRFTSILKTIDELEREGVVPRGSVVVVNGGLWQDVKLLHAHILPSEFGLYREISKASDPRTGSGQRTVYEREEVGASFDAVVSWLQESDAIASLREGVGYAAVMKLDRRAWVAIVSG